MENMADLPDEHGGSRASQGGRGFSSFSTVPFRACRRRADLYQTLIEEEGVEEICQRRWMITERLFWTRSVFRTPSSLSAMAHRYLRLPAGCGSLVRLLLRPCGATARTVGGGRKDRLTLTRSGWVRFGKPLRARTELKNSRLTYVFTCYRGVT